MTEAFLPAMNIGDTKTPSGAGLVSTANAQFMDLPYSLGWRGC